jgi:hypothetical protein
VKVTAPSLGMARPSSKLFLLLAADEPVCFSTEPRPQAQIDCGVIDKLAERGDLTYRGLLADHRMMPPRKRRIIR